MSKKHENNRYREEEKDELVNEDEAKETLAEEIDKDLNDKEDNGKVIEDLNEQIKNLKNEVLKCKANEINFKKHLEEDKNRSIKYANQSLL